MSQNNDANHPYHPPHRYLGRQLKTMRQRFQESLGETSGAVEIEVEQLDRFERGAEVPSEDILMLLISHFNMSDDDAVKLWELAGYDEQSFPFGDEAEERAQPAQSSASTSATSPNGAQPHVIMLALDQRILYTNGADIVADEDGLVLGFSQQDAHSGQNHTVSRVGMSYVQAEKLMQALQHALLHKQYMSGPRQLPPESK